ncbi:MAG: hypothetical protein ABJD07_07410, partial [Gemmatimonadaceae bacterium]
AAESFLGLMSPLGERISPATLHATMRTVGRELIGDRPRPTGSLRERTLAAVALFNEFGAVASVGRRGGGYVIRSLACPIAAISSKSPEACTVIESLLTAFVGASVHTCCARVPAEPCCFEVGVGITPSPAARHRRAG